MSGQLTGNGKLQKRRKEGIEEARVRKKSMAVNVRVQSRSRTAPARGWGGGGGGINKFPSALGLRRMRGSTLRGGEGSQKTVRYEGVLAILVDLPSVVY